MALHPFALKYRQAKVKYIHVFRNSGLLMVKISDEFICFCQLHLNPLLFYFFKQLFHFKNVVERVINVEFYFRYVRNWWRTRVPNSFLISLFFSSNFNWLLVYLYLKHALVNSCFKKIWCYFYRRNRDHTAIYHGHAHATKISLLLIDQPCYLLRRFVSVAVANCCR
jgi:hypothetical protein